MPVIGMQITKIEANKKGNISPGFKVESVPTVISVEEKELPAIGESGKVLTIGYNFSVSYKPDIAEIKFTGEILFLEEGKEKKAMKMWSKNRTLPQDIMIEIYNTIFRKGLIKALTISEDMQLPPPIQLPIVTPKKESDKDEKNNENKESVEGQSSYIG